MTPAEMLDWIAGAAPGDTITYHCGLLSRDRIYDRDVDSLGEAALAFADTGDPDQPAAQCLLDLTQVRLAPHTFAYRATRRRRASRRRPKTQLPPWRSPNR